MFTYPQIDAIAIQIGPIKIYWYGLMYLMGLVLAWFLAKSRMQKLNLHWRNETLSDFIFYCAIGIILGGRLGYVLFYGLSEFIHNPLFIFKTWEGGMSFHGGFLGVIVAVFCFARKIKFSFIELLDFTAPLVPLGIALGRIGNFINSELWGRVTTVSWGMVFPNGGPLPRHPSQFYEAFSEGILLFIIIWFYTKKTKPVGTTSALFLCCYGTFRFICEFFREPDQHLGFVAFNWLTTGQLLSIPMVIIGVYMLWFYTKKIKTTD